MIVITIPLLVRVSQFNLMYNTNLLFLIDICEHGQVRLAGSGYSTIGRIEVCMAGTWGTVCSDNFDQNDANVICTHLGYSQYG